MKLTYERDFSSTAQPGIRFKIRRISFAERLRFLSENHGIMQRLKFLSAGGGEDPIERSTAAELEIELSRRLLEACLTKIGDSAPLPPAGPEEIEWLLSVAPTELCVEVLSHVSDEIALTEARRKN